MSEVFGPQKGRWGEAGGMNGLCSYASGLLYPEQAAALEHNPAQEWVWWILWNLRGHEGSSWRAAGWDEECWLGSSEAEGEIRWGFGIKVTPVSGFCLSITWQWNSSADENEQNIPAVLPAVLYPVILARLHHALTMAEEIKLLLRLLLPWNHKTLANIKSSACNAEWMLLHGESCMYQPGVKHRDFLPPGTSTFSVQTVLCVSLQARIFRLKKG